MYKIRSLAIVIALLSSSTANAVKGWYVINNYEGTIGNFPVHFSIQYYDFGGKINIKGSYYYDKYRSPIPLYGKKTSDSIELCEVINNKEYDENLIEGKKYPLSNCQFKLTDNGSILYGVWNGNNKKINVMLNNTASLTNNNLSNTSTNSIEIPFWGQTDLHSFIGVYENSGNGLVIHKVNVLNKKTGKIDQVINPQLYNCDFGFYMTAVYQHIETDGKSPKIRLNCYSTGSDLIIGYHFDKK